LPALGPFDQSHNLASMRTRDTEPAMLARAVVPELFEEAMSLIKSPSTTTRRS